MLSVDLGQKMIPNNKDFLIHHDQTKGPSFGGGDLVIADQCNRNKSSFSNFPSSYNREGPRKYYAGRSSYRMFSGAEEGSGFRVKEYEVFQVIYP